MRSDCSPSLVPEGRGQQEEIGLGSKHKAYRGDSPPLLPQLLPGLFLQKDPCQGLAKEKKVKKKKKKKETTYAWLRANVTRAAKKKIKYPNY